MLTASLVPGLCLGCVPLLGADTAAVLAVTSLALTCYGSMFCGVFSNHADLAPSLAGTLMAVTNMVATLPGVLSTIICKYCVPRNIIKHLDMLQVSSSRPLLASCWRGPGPTSPPGTPSSSPRPPCSRWRPPCSAASAARTCSRGVRRLGRTM